MIIVTATKKDGVVETYLTDDIRFHWKRFGLHFPIVDPNANRWNWKTYAGGWRQFDYKVYDTVTVNTQDFQAYSSPGVLTTQAAEMLENNEVQYQQHLIDRKKK